uniref:transketolase-like n=1 Tax=Styela clava TaxID=7725 RepID=UPI001939E44A|nr:transketolase-like [Styela clava]
MSDVYHIPDAGKIEELNNIANRIRINSIKCTSASNSGHPTSSSSAADLLSVLFFQTMKFHPHDPRNPSDDRFVMSKGHACPALYSAWVETGHITEEELMQLRTIGSDLEGHPTPRLDFIDVATGSLGQGINAAAGMAYVGKYIDKASYRVYCMLGDGEVAEGSVWEAMMFGSYYKLDNFVTIIDVNRLGQSQATALGHDMETYRKRVDAFGWNAIVVDGHDIPSICKAFYDAETCKGKPSCIIAKTFKGRNILGQENLENFHGKPVPPAEKSKILEHLESLISGPPTGLQPQAPVDDAPAVDISNIKLSSPPNYKIGDKVSSRKGYGNAIAKLGKNNERVIALDGDVKNSTYSIEFKKAFPGSANFIECFIAEQNLVGAAIGAGTRGRTVPFCSTFSAFYTRAFDHIRMGAVSQTNVNFVGTHCGVAIGADGPSQMALEDIAMFRTIPGSTVFYPSDAVSTERSAELAANTSGICFIRASRQDDYVIYENDREFKIGRANILQQSEKDTVTVVGAGVTLHEAMKAYETLKGKGIHIRVVDPFTIKPLDKATISACAKATDGRIITVEDHYPEGGLGGAVAEALADTRGIILRRLAVKEIPRSGKPAELLSMFGIDAASIVKAVQELSSQ